MELKGKCRRGRWGGRRTWDWKLHFPHHLEAPRVGPGSRRGKHRVSLSSLRRAGGSCRGSGVFARRKRSSRVLAPRGCSQLPRARAAWESWLLLAPAAGPSLPSTIYSQARWDASLLPSRRCGEQKPARAWGGSLQREQRGELQPCAPPGSLQAAGHIPAAWLCPCCKSSPFLTPPASIWGRWKCPPCQTLSRPCSRGPVPGQAGEAAPARRAHALQRRVIGALCHSAAYNWRSIVSGWAG